MNFLKNKVLAINHNCKKSQVKKFAFLSTSLQMLSLILSEMILSINFAVRWWRHWLNMTINQVNLWTM